MLTEENNTIDFEGINREFSKINRENFDLCKQCGGYCENSEMFFYLPGEAKYIAQKIKSSTKEFERKYVNKLKYKNRIIDLLKIGTCPFLKTYKCQLEKYNAKLIVCLLYPVAIEKVSGKNKISLDTYFCPMAEKFPKKYVSAAKNIYKKIQNKIPNYWLEFATECDPFVYDYKKLAKLKNKKFITIKELAGCIKNESK